MGYSWKFFIFANSFFLCYITSIQFIFNWHGILNKPFNSLLPVPLVCMFHKYKLQDVTFYLNLLSSNVSKTNIAKSHKHRIVSSPYICVKMWKKTLDIIMGVGGLYCVLGRAGCSCEIFLYSFLIVWTKWFAILTNTMHRILNKKDAVQVSLWCQVSNW